MVNPLRRLRGALDVLDPLVEPDRWRLSDTFADLGRASERSGLTGAIKATSEQTGLADLIDRSRRALELHAPGVRRSLDIFDPNPAPAPNNPFTGVRQFANEIGALGQETVGEPLAYGVNRAVGINAGPAYSGRNRATLKEASKEADNPLLKVAGLATATGIDLATDPLTYLTAGRSVPLKSLLAANLLSGHQIGGFGGQTLAENVARGALATIGVTAGEEIGGAVGGDTGKLVGSLAGPAAATMLGARVPGLSSVLHPTAELPQAAPTVLAARQVQPALPTGYTSGIGHTNLPDPSQRTALDAIRALAPRFAGAGVGAGVGALSGDTEEERLRNAAIGAGLGFAGVTAAQKAKDVLHVAAPATGWGEDFNKLRMQLANESRSEARVHAYLAKRQGEKAQRAWEGALRTGEVQLTTPGQIALNTLEGLEQTPGAVRGAFYDMQVAIQHPEWFDIQSQSARDAVSVVQTVLENQALRDQSKGVLHTILDRYTPEYWLSGPTFGQGEVGPSEIVRRLGLSQNFQKQKSLPGHIEGIAEGYVPKSRDIGATLEARVQAGYEAAAQQKFTTALTQGANTPGAMVFRPLQWDATKQKMVSVPVPEGYVPLDQPFARRLFPTLDAPDARAALQQAAHDIQAGANTGIVVRDLLRDLRHEIGVGVNQLYVRKDVAEGLSNYFSRVDDTSVVGAMRGVMGGLREARLGMDLAMIGRLIPQAWTSAGGLAHPFASSSVVGKTLATALSKDGYEKMLRDPRYQWLAARGEGFGPGDLGPILDKTRDHTWLGRGPVIGQVWRAVGEPLEEWQFGRFTPALKFYTTMAIYDRMAKPGSKWVQRYGNDGLAERIADVVTSRLAGVSATRAGLSQTSEAAQQLALLSPGWWRGAVRSVAGVGRTDLEGHLTRRYWANIAATGVAMSAGLTAAFQGNVFDMQRYLDPRSPDAVTNPFGSNFLKIALPGGEDFVDPFAPATPIVRALMKPFAGAVREGAQAADRASDDPYKAAVQAGLRGFAGNLEALSFWQESRRSVPVGLGLDLARNQDTLGRVIARGDSGGERLGERAQFALSQVLPGVTNVFYDTSKGAIPEWGVTEDTLKQGVGQFFGENVRPARDVPPEIETKVRAFLRDNGVDPGPDPLGRYRSAEQTAVPLYKRTEFEQKNPEVRTFIQQARQQTAGNIPAPNGLDAVRKFVATKDQLANQRDTAIQALNDRYRTGAIVGNDYRAERAKIQGEYASAVNGASAAWLGVEYADVKKRQERIDYLYDRDPAEKARLNPVDEARDLLYTLTPKDATSASMRSFARERRRYLLTGEYRDQEGNVVQHFAPDTMAKVRELLSNTTDPVERAYHMASEDYGAYSEMPIKPGISPEETDRVLALMQRAKQRIQYGIVPPGESAQTMAILLDRSASSGREKMLAMMWNRLPTNPQRAWYLKTHARTVGSFYSDLPDLIEEVETS